MQPKQDKYAIRRMKPKFDLCRDCGMPDRIGNKRFHDYNCGNRWIHVAVKTTLNPYQIADACEHLDGPANIRAINELYRRQDESHKWPISGKFNATSRAIRRVRTLSQDVVGMHGLEYSLAIDAELSNIVNGEISS